MFFFIVLFMVGCFRPDIGWLAGLLGGVGSISSLLMQGKLTEGKASVQLTSTLT
jgi:hypothetical protein